jgi:hypothetical protein
MIMPTTLNLEHLQLVAVLRHLRDRVQVANNRVENTRQSPASSGIDQPSSARPSWRRRAVHEHDELGVRRFVLPYPAQLLLLGGRLLLCIVQVPPTTCAFSSLIRSSLTLSTFSWLSRRSSRPSSMCSVS